MSSLQLRKNWNQRRLHLHLSGLRSSLDNELEMHNWRATKGTLEELKDFKFSNKVSVRLGEQGKQKLKEIKYCNCVSEDMEMRMNTEEDFLTRWQILQYQQEVVRYTLNKCYKTKTIHGYASTSNIF